MPTATTAEEDSRSKMVLNHPHDFTKRQIYKQDFTAKTRACIQRSRAVYDRDQLNNDNYFIFCGGDIFVFTKTPAGFLFTEIGMND